MSALVNDSLQEVGFRPVLGPCCSTLSKMRPQRNLNVGGFEKKADQTITDPDGLSLEIDRIRANGYSQNNAEFIDGIVALAAPVRDSSRRIV